MPASGTDCLVRGIPCQAHNLAILGSTPRSATIEGGVRRARRRKTEASGVIPDPSAKLIAEWYTKSGNGKAVGVIPILCGQTMERPRMLAYIL